MHSLSSMLVASLLTLAAPHRTAAARPTDASKEVLAYERAACAAYQRNDAVAIDSLVGDGYTLTDGHGTVTTKADDIRDAKSQAVRYTDFHNEDMQVRFYGNTAIVIGKTIVKGTTSGGDNVDIVVAFTDTIVKIDGRWRLVAGHVSRLKNS